MKPLSVLTFPHDEAIFAEDFKPLSGTTSKKVIGSRPGSYWRDLTGTVQKEI